MPTSHLRNGSCSRHFGPQRPLPSQSQPHEHCQGNLRSPHEAAPPRRRRPCSWSQVGRCEKSLLPRSDFIESLSCHVIHSVLYLLAHVLCIALYFEPLSEPLHKMQSDDMLNCSIFTTIMFMVELSHLHQAIFLSWSNTAFRHYSAPSSRFKDPFGSSEISKEKKALAISSCIVSQQAISCLPSSTITYCLLEILCLAL